MDYQSWIEGIDGLASLYSFDILPDGSFSEIRLMAVNRQNVGMLQMNPNAPEFYPGIPYRNYWMDLNFESFVYKCASTKQPLYSYVNARGVWLKGFYLPIAEIRDAPLPTAEGAQTVYCLYIITYSDQVETDSMSQKSSEVANAVMEISIKLHETHDFYQAMAKTAEEIREFCGAEKCSIYTMDQRTRDCAFINESGIQEEYLRDFAAEMNRTPYEVAEAWERDLALSDYAIRYNQTLVGFIWAANYEVEKMERIKETLELSTFLIAAVITNHQLVSRLEVKSTVDELTHVGNRNAMTEYLEAFASGEQPLPKQMGIVFADLNGLKAVNDIEGHDAGDKLLTRAAALLRIAFADQEIFRAGGDEFMVFCPEIAKEQLDLRVQQLRGLADNTLDVSFAVGTAYCVGEYDLPAAIKVADETMYADKAAYYRDHPEKDRRKRNR